MQSDSAATTPPSKPTAPPWVQFSVSLLVLSISCLFLLARLGHYALWDDEAITALTATGVWKTGDTSAVHGHNVLAYRDGLLLRDMKDRATPPLQFYLAAPFMGVLGETSLAARLPFALCGLGTVGLMLWWLHRDRASTMLWILLGIALVTNVSFFLFARQARYYGLTMLLAVAVAYSYLHLRTQRGLIVHALLSILLLAANYMTWAAVMVMMLVDYIIWGRRRRALGGWDWAVLLVPQAIVGAVIVSIWNPLRIAEPRPQDLSWLEWHATLLWWNLRDLNACEFGVGALLLAAPVVALVTRSMWLTRGIVALAMAILFISIVTPQNPSDTDVADVRYLSFLIPLCIAIGVMALLPLARASRTLAIALACFAFGGNFLNFSLVTDQPMRSTPYKYANELFRPVPEPFTPVADWIRQNVKHGESVLIAPPHMMYPLMFHAPNAVYAWQLNDPPPTELAHLPPIHVSLREAPDYIVAFGPARRLLEGLQMKTYEAINYEPAQQIDPPWLDLYRPELFWRVFDREAALERAPEGITIFRRVRPQPSFRL